MNYYVYQYRKEYKFGIWRDADADNTITLDTIVSGISASMFNSWAVPPFFLEGIGWRLVHKTENFHEALGCACIEMV